MYDICIEFKFININFIIYRYCVKFSYRIFLLNFKLFFYSGLNFKTIIGLVDFFFYININKTLVSLFDYLAFLCANTIHKAYYNCLPHLHLPNHLPSLQLQSPSPPTSPATISTLPYASIQFCIDSQINRIRINIFNKYSKMVSNPPLPLFCCCMYCYFSLPLYMCVCVSLPLSLSIIIIISLCIYYTATRPSTYTLPFSPPSPLDYPCTPYCLI